MDKLKMGNANFAFDIYKIMSKDKENVFLSPWSISVALSMLVNGANGNTRTELIEALHLDQFKDQNEINEAFKNVIKALSNSTGCTVSTANRLYVKKNFEVEADFKSSLQNHYKSKAVNVNFSNNVEGQINEWVASQTNDLIKDLFAPSTFNSETRLVLVNAIYFKGMWANKFESNETKLEAFYLTNAKKIKTKLMNIKTTFYYADNVELDCKIIQLPYDGGHSPHEAWNFDSNGNRVVMYVILPNKKKGLGELKEKLSAEAFKAMRKEMVVRKVKVKLPAFQMRFRRDLIPDLKALKVEEVFEEVKADLSLINSLNQLYVSDAIHEAFVSVDEAGTEAAAATALVVRRKKSKSSSKPKTYNFIADHPFVFLIYDLETDMTLFIGSLDNPTN